MPLSTVICDREFDKFDVTTSGETAVRTLIDGVVNGSFTPSGLNIAGKVTEVTIDNTSWTAIPATALTDRNALGIQNRSGQAIKINYDNTVVGYVGMEISDGEERQYDITDAITVYAKSQTSSATINVEELA